MHSLDCNRERMAPCSTKFNYDEVLDKRGADAIPEKLTRTIETHKDRIKDEIYLKQLSNVDN